MKAELNEGEVVESCPMCGGPASLRATENQLFWVKCDDVECGTTQTAGWNRDRALDAWNERHLPVPPPKNLDARAAE